jgi:hypothetical protein
MRSRTLTSSGARCGALNSQPSTLMNKRHSTPSRARKSDAPAIKELRSRGFKNPAKTLKTLKKALKEVAGPRKSSFKLPTLAAFKRLPLLERTKVFRDWAKTKPARETYNARSNSACALSQFALAFGITSDAGCCDFDVAGESVPVISRCGQWDMQSPIFPNCREACEYPQLSTFGDLVKRLDAHIAKHAAKLEARRSKSSSLTTQ